MNAASGIHYALGRGKPHGVRENGGLELGKALHSCSVGGLVSEMV